jgi:hypothetical protein
MIMAQAAAGFILSAAGSYQIQLGLSASNLLLIFHPTACLEHCTDMRNWQHIATE